jgi:hypothetical protein
MKTRVKFKTTYVNFHADRHASTCQIPICHSIQVKTRSESSKHVQLNGLSFQYISLHVWEAVVAIISKVVRCPRFVHSIKVVKADVRYREWFAGRTRPDVTKGWKLTEAW